MDVKGSTLCAVGWGHRMFGSRVNQIRKPGLYLVLSEGSGWRRMLMEGRASLSSGVPVPRSSQRRTRMSRSNTKAQL